MLATAAAHTPKKGGLKAPGPGSGTPSPSNKGRGGAAGVGGAAGTAQRRAPPGRAGGCPPSPAAEPGRSRGGAEPRALGSLPAGRLRLRGCGRGAAAGPLPGALGREKPLPPPRPGHGGEVRRGGGGARSSCCRPRGAGRREAGREAGKEGRRQAAGRGRAARGGEPEAAGPGPGRRGAGSHGAGMPGMWGGR